MSSGKTTTPVRLIAAVALWIAAASNFALWDALRGLALPAGGGAGLALALGAIVFFTLTGLLALFAWRWSLKPVLLLLLLTSAIGAFFMTGYHVVIDPTMMVNALQTDMHEVRDLVNLRLFGFLAVLWLLPSLLLLRSRIDYAAWPRRALRNTALFAVSVLALLLVTVASFDTLASNMRNHRELRYLLNPLNSVYALAYLAVGPTSHHDTAPLAIASDAQIAAPAPGTRPPLLVLALGETGRSGNFSLNGYGRDTNPELARERLLSFRDAWSCGTSTAASVPCMFSHLGRKGYEAREHEYQGLLDLVQQSGMAVLWLDNQSGCKGACDRVPHSSTANLSHPVLCPGNECYDGIMLEDLDARIAALDPERRARGVVIVMHQIGSHGPAYYKRSPEAFKSFQPECASNELPQCSRAELVNAYDNTIRYTDHVLASTITWLKTQQAAYAPALLYVADHGESLGENNLYLHGMPWLIAPDVQKHVPWISWFGAGFEKANRLSYSCLHGRLDQKLTHDNYFHSVLGLLGIQTGLYQPALDAYASCRSEPGKSETGPVPQELMRGDLSDVGYRPPRH
jgi:lipid A ethanolaminephosphotransferase